MSLGFLILLLSVPLLAWLLAAVKKPAFQGDKIINVFLASPFIIIITYSVYGFFIADPKTCGANSGGLCFSMGLFVGLFVFPLCTLSAIIIGVRALLRMTKNPRKTKNPRNTSPFKP